MSKLKKVIFEYEDKTLSASDVQAEKWQQNFTEMLGWADCENNNKFVSNPVSFEVGEVSDSSTATAIEITSLKEKHLEDSEKYIATIEELQESVLDVEEKYEALQKKFDALVQESVILTQLPIPVEPEKISSAPAEKSASKKGK